MTYRWFSSGSNQTKVFNILYAIFDVKAISLMKVHSYWAEIMTMLRMMINSMFFSLIKYTKYSLKCPDIRKPLLSMSHPLRMKPNQSLDHDKHQHFVKILNRDRDQELQTFQQQKHMLLLGIEPLEECTLVS